MKRFLIKLIATTLLLIVILSSFGCFGCWSCITGGEYISCREQSEEYIADCIGGPSLKDKRLKKELEDKLSKIPLEISGYELVWTDNNTNNLPKTITYNDIIYNVQRVNIYKNYEHYYAITITKVDDIDSKILIDTNYIKERSVSAKSFLTVLDECNRAVELSPYYLIEFDGKLFIYCIGETGLSKGNHHEWTPPMIFEYDIETESIKYAGFAKDGELGMSKYVHAKIVKTN